MVYLVLLLSSLTCWFSVLLLWRLNAAIAPIRNKAKKLGAAEFIGPFVRFLDWAVDDSLLADVAAKGLADLDLRFREHQDAGRTAGELASHIAENGAVTDFQTLTGLIKSLYQLQYTLGVPAEYLNECLAFLVERLKVSSAAARPIGRTELISAGALLDRNTMMPLINGTHVEQPLGLVVFDNNGKVLSKAKVLCS